jgi:enamine deaminase RidA (YjgF/YER057c/UK114 family)
MAPNIVEAAPHGDITKYKGTKDRHHCRTGHLPIEPNGRILTGRIGESLDTEAAHRAAILAGLGILATLRAQLGSLAPVCRLIKLLGVANCTPDFKAQPAVLNGASELFATVFGPNAGVGTRSAIAAPSLPLGVPVEIAAIFEIDPG